MSKPERMCRYADGENGAVACVAGREKTALSADFGESGVAEAAGRGSGSLTGICRGMARKNLSDAVPERLCGVCAYRKPPAMRNALFCSAQKADCVGAGNRPQRSDRRFVRRGGWPVVHLRGNNLGDQRPCQFDAGTSLPGGGRTHSGSVCGADRDGTGLHAGVDGRAAASGAARNGGEAGGMPRAASFPVPGYGLVDGLYAQRFVQLDTVDCIQRHVCGALPDGRLDSGLQTGVCDAGCLPALRAGGWRLR